MLRPTTNYLRTFALAVIASCLISIATAQNQTAISLATAQNQTTCLRDDFTILSAIDTSGNEYGMSLYLGFAAPSRVPEENASPPPPFGITRFVWTVEPSYRPDDNNTYVYSYPEGLVIATYSRWDGTLTFQPNRTDYYGEAGLVIQVPPEHLSNINFKDPSGSGGYRAQIYDGFPNLATIRLESDYNFDVSPGEGLELKVQTLPGTVKNSTTVLSGGLGIQSTGWVGGLDLDVQVDTLAEVDITCYSSRLVIRANDIVPLGSIWVQDGALQGECTKGEQCGTTVFLDAPLRPFDTFINVTNVVEINMTMHCQNGMQCADIIEVDTEGTGFDCQNSDVGAADFVPFPCTIIPNSPEDVSNVLFCDTTLATNLSHYNVGFTRYSGYGCSLLGATPFQMSESSAWSVSTTVVGAISLALVGAYYSL